MHSMETGKQTNENSTQWHKRSGDYKEMGVQQTFIVWNVNTISRIIYEEKNETAATKVDTK